MKAKLLLLLGLLCCTALPAADDPKPVPVVPPGPDGITLPPLTTPEAPVPAPKPPPSSITKLTPGMFYIIESKSPFTVIDSPAGRVKITDEKGPLKIRGLFVDDQKNISTRTFNGPYIASIEAVVTGRVELIVFPVGEIDRAKFVRRQLDVAVLPIPPPPDPVDPVDPKPPPSPAPIPDAGKWVMMMFERGDISKLTNDQRMIFTADAVLKYLDSHTTPSPDGKTSGWRTWDQNDIATNEAPIWQKMFARAKDGAAAYKGAGKALPWIVISVDGKTGYEGPVPANIPAMLTLLQTYLGK